MQFLDVITRAERTKRKIISFARTAQVSFRGPHLQHIILCIYTFILSYIPLDDILSAAIQCF